MSVGSVCGCEGQGCVRKVGRQVHWLAAKELGLPTSIRSSLGCAAKKDGCSEPFSRFVERSLQR